MRWSAGGELGRGLTLASLLRPAALTPSFPSPAAPPCLGPAPRRPLPSLCRHLKLRCVFRPGSPYSDLLSEFDRVQLPRLAKFQQLCAYRRHPRAEPLLVPVPGAAPQEAGSAEDGGGVPLQVAPALQQYYDALLAKYIPQGVLLW